MPITKKNGSGYVTWPNFLTIILTVALLAGGLNAWALAQFEKRMDGQFVHVHKQLDKIDRKLEEK